MQDTLSSTERVLSFPYQQVLKYVLYVYGFNWLTMATWFFMIGDHGAHI